MKRLRERSAVGIDTPLVPVTLTVETPATRGRKGEIFAWVPKLAFDTLSGGALMLLALLAGLQLLNRPVELTRRELAESLGCSDRALRYWIAELERRGWLDRGSLKLKRRKWFRKGWRARCDISKVAATPPSAFRAYVGLLFGQVDGMRVRTYHAIAQTMKRHRSTLWAARKQLAGLGYKLAGRVSHAIVEAVQKVTSKQARGRGRRVPDGWRKAARHHLKSVKPSPET